MTCAARRSRSSTAPPLFGGFTNAEYGATDAHLHTDIAAAAAHDVAICTAPTTAVARGDHGVRLRARCWRASRRLTKTAAAQTASGSRCADAGTVMTAVRDEVKHQTGADQIKAETITRFTRNQLIQMVLLVALVYVAYPFISSVPAFFSELRTANWWWALARSGGLGAEIPRCRGGAVGVRRRAGQLPQPDDHAGGQHVRRDDDACRCRWPGAEHPVPAEGRTRRAARHHGGGAAAVGPGDHPRHAADHVQRAGRRVGGPVAVRAERDGAVPDRRRGARRRSAIFLFVPKLRRWLATAVRPAAARR